ncbi:MAG: tetratricopeptide repeat protein [Pseudanabaenaceae cyanobacterium SKYGB_i_bin29]|nr:tetratricopeptide repeat protein [Pseudanabaenaceae cyanobacterium SKYG29]MDW8420411.1 tetratricopeptide repeat protein [Pseudanabaenaceae cyanobacterium SKYGB_i_bin29]
MSNQHWELAIKHHQQQEWLECLRQLEQLISINPNHVEGIRLKANVLEQLGRNDQAVATYQQALDLAPQCFEINHELGRLLWKVGKHGEALPLLEHATHLQPQSYQAWADLGVTYYVLKNFSQAITCLTKSLEIDPDRADTLASLAVVYAEQKETELAIKYFEKSLSLQPDNPQTLCNYGALLSQAGKHEEAIAQYRKAIEIQPNLAHAYSNLGVLLREIGKLDEGIEQCRKAIEINPNLADAYGNLALLLKEKGELDEAIALCHKALELDPDNLNALNNLGNALQDKNELETAIDVYNRLLKEDPNNAKALANLANALQKQEALEEAIESYKKALAVQPGYALAHNNLGNAYLRKGDVDAAIENYQKAAENDANYPEARFHLGMAYLLKGRIKEGFQYYEYRWEMKEFIEKNGKPSYDEPRWDGRELSGETVLLLNEQGIGDRIQFIRYASLIKARGGRVMYECPKILHRLFATYKDIDILISEGFPRPKFDYWIPLQSVPAAVGTSLETIPNSVPYLFPLDDPNSPIPDLIATHGKNKLKVGIVWASSLTHKTSPKRSIPLTFLRELFELDHIQFFSLQKDMKEEDAELLKTLNLVDLREELKDFADTATAIQHLDLVISVDTAVAHLAGAMAKEVWVLLPFMPDWRWMLDRTDSPWYPTARLFRQAQSKDWLGVIAQVKDSLLSFTPTPYIFSTKLKRSSVEIRQIIEALNEQQEALKLAQKALQAYEEGNYQEAVEQGSKVLEIAPDYAEVLNMMGVSVYKLGDAAKGAEYLQKALELAPKHKDIPANLGLILDRLGQIPAAIECFRRALEIKPTPEVHNNLGNAYQKLGDNEKAIEQYRLAISYGKKDPKHYFNLGNALKAINDWEGALENFQQAIEIKPDYARAYDGIGLVYSAQGKLEEAIENYRKAIAIDPNNSNYHLHLGNAYARKKDYESAQIELNRALELNENCVEALRSLAGIAIEHKQGETAVKILRRALELTPHCPDTRINLAVALIQVEQFAEAEKFLREALEIKPGYPEAYINLGVIANKREEYELACDYFRQAIERKPDAVGAYLNYGLALAMQEKLEEAIEAFRAILRYQPNHPDAHMNIGIATMSLGKLKEGWAEYEWRHHIQEYNSRIHRLSQPLWDGKPFPNKTLLIYTEQGLGDCIQFSRYIPLVKKMGGRVIVECNQEPLRNIMKTVEGADAVYVIGDELPHFDYHYPLMSLPHLLGIDLHKIPHNLPHFRIDKSLHQLPQKRPSNLKVGIVWTANLGNPTTGKKRTIPLPEFLPLLDVQGVDFYILQKDVFEEEKPLLEKYNDRVVSLCPLLQDLVDTAALVQHLDLVVTVDTMIGHLAGTFNVPTWIILPFAPDWRWLLKRQDTPWYKSVRLFRRFAKETWQPVIRRVKQQLELYQQHYALCKEREKYRRMMQKRPNYGEAYNNLGTLEIVLGDYAAAETTLRKSVELCPNLTEAKLNLATALLSAGKLQEGFSYYLYRWQVEGFCSHNQKPNYRQPKWDGREDMSNKILYIHPEQGFGDQIQFVRYLSLIKSRVKALYYGCHKSLVRLFQEVSSIDRLVTDGDQYPEFDYYIPLGDIPSFFSYIPFTSSYLIVPTNYKWQEYFIGVDKLKIGVTWETASTHPTAKERSIGLPYLHQLFYRDDCQFYIIQPQISAEDRKILQLHGDTVIDLSTHITDFRDTAEIINYLDLVITIDSAVAHLAGAMGKKTWILLPHVFDWRWQYNWYDSARLFVQPKLSDWQSVVDSVSDAIDTLLLGEVDVESLASQSAIAYQNGQIDLAITTLQQAVKLSPTRHDLVFALGNMLGQTSRLEEAIAVFQRIYQSNPDYPGLKEAMAKAYFNWGNALNEQEDHRGAINLYLQALAYNPNFAKAHTNLGIAYGKLGDLESSIYHYKEAIKLHPNHAQIYTNFATTLQQNDRYDEAREMFEQALAVNPKSAEAHSGLASIYRDTGELERALIHHSAAIEIDPTYANARFNLAQTLLLAGHFSEGWREYEWRFKSKQFLEQGFVAPQFKEPQWDGSDIFGKKILILTEQGIGDQIQFIRYAKVLKDRGARAVFYACPEPLLELLKCIPWIDKLIPPGEACPTFDCWVSLLSLPYLCGTTLDSIPCPVPYLSVPFDFTERNADARAWVGICWASRSASLSAKRRSSSLSEFAQLFDVPGVKFISLQKEITEEEAEILSQHGVVDTSDKLTNFYETAKIVQNLDLVITIDTSVAHIAAAMGKPTWILLNFSPDWRWMTDRVDSPWYPSVRLFRQKSHLTNDWQDVIREIKVALQFIFTPLSPLEQFNQAVTCYRSGNIQQAESICQELIDSGQDIVSANHLLGVIKVQEKQPEIALSYLYKALTYYPLEGGIHHAVGGTLLYLRHLELALFYLHRSLQIEPNSIETWNNLGSAYGYLNEIDKSIRTYQQSIQVRDNGEARFGIAVNLLKQGNYAVGFREYEWRWQQIKFQFSNPIPAFTQPRWHGRDLTDKTILVWTEQGAGDQIQFWRFLPLLKQKGAKRVIYACSDELLPLARSLSSVDDVLQNGQPLPAFDYWIPLMSLPHLLGITLDNLPKAHKYLTAPPLPTTLMNFFSETNKLKVGLVWACKKDHETFIDRSIPFHLLQPLLAIVDVQYYLLQKDIPEGDQEFIDRYPNLINLQPYLTDFGVTAAIIDRLDVVITVDTAVAHLSGALGKPTWVLLPFSADWRWLLEGFDTPWYPTITLLRQKRRKYWADVISAAASKLDEYKKQPRQPQFSQRREKKKIAIGWSLGLNTGWGVFGTNLALQLLFHPHYQPVLLSAAGLDSGHYNPLMQKLIAPLLAEWYRLHQLLGQNPQGVFQLDVPVVHALGNGISCGSRDKFVGSRNIGFIFFENTLITEEDKQRAKQYDLILAGSSWNTRILKQNGIDHVYTVLQGIDPTLFHPAPKSGLFSDRFVIFSGGKIEFRKGQDIVVAAFKRFYQKHPDALLVFAWHNFWSQFMLGMDQTGNVKGLPQLQADKQRLDITSWLIENGLPPESFYDVGLVPNYLMPLVYREADVALFPNRCEGGTNLVAMECLACGVPTILSANTGHLDLIDESHCYPLTKQAPVPSHPIFPGTQDWGESDIEEILEVMERVYNDRVTAQQKGQQAALFMQNLTWEKQVRLLIAALEETRMS